jgi:hypothetical protein
VSGTLGFVDAARLQNIWEHYRTGASSISGAWLWYPITLEAWLRSFAPKKASG